MTFPLTIAFLLLLLVLAVTLVVIRSLHFIRRLRQENCRLQQQMHYWQRRYNQSLGQSIVKTITFREDAFEALKPSEFAEIVAEVIGGFQLN